MFYNAAKCPPYIPYPPKKFVCKFLKSSKISPTDCMLISHFFHTKISRHAFIFSNFRLIFGIFQKNYQIWFVCKKWKSLKFSSCASQNHQNNTLLFPDRPFQNNTSSLHPTYHKKCILTKQQSLNKSAHVQTNLHTSKQICILPDE